MYESFYGFREMPFRITPDPRFLYPSLRHREAVETLLYGITQRQGFLVLVGDVGCGKTTICRAVLAQLPPDVETALILNPGLSANQVVKAILSDLGVETRARDRLGLLDCLNAHLLEMTARGRNVAVVIDEAQNLTPELMEQVRLLSNLETDEHKLMQIVLAGQPELEQRLRAKSLRQLRQRIMVHCALAPLELDDMRGYVQHRLRTAGREDNNLFDDAAIRCLHAAGGGIPRLMNKLCDRALLAGYADGAERIGLAHARRAVRELESLR